MAPVRDLKIGDLVWVTCSAPEQAAFVRGKVTQLSDAGVNVEVGSNEAKCDAGKSRIVPRADVRFRHERENGSTCADSTALVHMNDASILDNLRLRHAKDEIYTYTASVLLAVNPYKEISGLYGDAQCEKYRGRHIGALPPHPYAIADSSYRMLTREQKNQALLISGESGAGKTETAKIVMKYLAYTSGTGSDHAAKIQDRVQCAQPILESFGNAATLRNSNSSRFGKYNRLFFDEAGALVNAGVTTYLLESSRTVVHGCRERNYHVFYEMLAGLSDDKLKEFRLERKRPYQLLCAGEEHVPGFEERDARNFGRLVESLKTVGFDDTQVNDTLRILAGLAHLGDIASVDENGALRLDNAADEDDRTVEVNEETADAAAAMLGIDAVELVGMLKRKRIQIPGRRSFHLVARTQKQFRQTLHSFIKAIYGRLFEYIVDRINTSFHELKPEASAPAEDVEVQEEDGQHIGILDIYGFERLQHNSFEQLCINLANERLQQYFVENVLAAEQGLYRREGLPWTDLMIPDAQPVVRCVQQVFTTLDDFSYRLAKGMEKDASDARFCEKIVQDASTVPEQREILKKPQVKGRDRRTNAGYGNNESFTIRHYAGIVEYSTLAWPDKNNDRLLPECEDLIVDAAGNAAVRALALPDADRGDKRVPFRSISKKYQQDLEALLQTLGTCNLHYIRCFKPNEEQKPKVFNQQLVLDQIVQCGTIELVKIMHDGYPNRCPLSDIVDTFKGMLPPAFQRFGARTFIEALMLAYKVPREEWILGMSRLFLKAGQLKALEDMRNAGASPDPEELKKIVSGIIRKRWNRGIHAVCVCNYVPKFLRKLRVERCLNKLRRAVSLASVLARKLKAARQRIQERKLRAQRRLMGAIRVTLFITGAVRRAKAKRRERVEKALFTATRTWLLTRRWVAIGRERAAEAKNQRAMEERRLQDERKRLEEQRKREAAEAAKRREEEEQRRELEAKERAENEAAKAKQDAERMKELEEERAQSLMKFEQQKKEMEEQQKELEEARRAMQAEKDRMEEERRKIQLQLQEEKERDIEETKRKLQEEYDERFRRMSSGIPQAESGKPPLSQRPGTSTTGSNINSEEDVVVMTARTSTHVEEDEITPADSVSAFVVPEADKHQLLQQIQTLKEEKAEMSQRMKKLEMEGARSPTPAESPAASSVGGRVRQQASPLELDSGRMTPPTPDIPTAASPLDLGSGGRCRAERRLSMSDSRVSMSRQLHTPSTGGDPRQRRNSAIQNIRGESARMSLASTSGGPRMSLTNAPQEEHQGQRAWWAQQREFLMEDLYPTSMCSQKQRRGSLLGSRASIGGRTPGSGADAGAGPRSRHSVQGETAACDLGDRFAAAAEGEQHGDDNALEGSKPARGLKPRKYTSRGTMR